MDKGCHCYKLAKKSARQCDAKLYVQRRQQQNRISPKAYLARKQVKTLIKHRSSEVHLHPENVVAADRMGKLQNRLKKQNKMAAQRLRLTQQLNHSS